MLQLAHSSAWQRDPGLAATVAAPTPPSHTFQLHALAHMLGVNKRGERWIVRYLTALIAAEDFPAPLPMMIGDTLSNEIHARKSRWLATAVRAWFLSRTPAQAVATIEGAEALEAAAEAERRMDDRADNLFSRGRA